RAVQQHIGIEDVESLVPTKLRRLVITTTLRQKIRSAVREHEQLLADRTEHDLLGDGVLSLAVRRTTEHRARSVLRQSHLRRRAIDRVTEVLHRLTRLADAAHVRTDEHRLVFVTTNLDLTRSAIPSGSPRVALRVADRRVDASDLGGEELVELLEVELNPLIRLAVLSVEVRTTEGLDLVAQVQIGAFVGT